MAHSALLNSASYAPETDFAEDVSTVNTLRLPLCAPIDTSGLQHPLIDPTPAKQNGMDGADWIDGTQDGTFKTRLWLTGHGSSTSGATSIGLVETLICNYVLGSGSGAAVSAASGTTTSGGTAAAWTTAASATFAAGSLCRLGTLGDTRGNGQFYAVGTHVSTTLTPLTQPPDDPAADDVVYSAVTGYTQSTTSTMKSARFLLQNPGYQYLCHGCVPTAYTLGGLNASEVPYIEITWAVAAWKYSTATFPSTVTTEEFTPSSVANGSFFHNDVGTADSQLRTSVRSVTIEHTLNTIREKGTGGAHPHQAYVNALRGVGGETVKITFTDDSEATTGTPFWQGLQASKTAQQILYTLNPIAGKAMGFYFPNCRFTDGYSVQMAEDNVNRVKVTMMANTGPTTTNELTKSAMRIGWA